ncbi:MAG: 30S ribosomal protein S12 methylthiotransferase RimO [bacterium]|nr:30S ribosomal protein S12 methylthiotransferase RimO [bacterium]MDY5457000.1 30S ribosomal protein S12 methylthiotransferase RimO [Bariatricus sp.]
MNILFVSLGCDKNLVDTEVMLGLLAKKGHQMIDDETQADIVIVNTCCFIHDAKEESIQTILEMAQLKETAALKKLIVTGCLAQRYKEEILEEIPEVDAVLGTTSYDEIAEVIDGLFSDSPMERADARMIMKDVDYLPETQKGRLVTTGGHFAYLKIAEGCDKHCTYCIIPKIRGNFRSVPMEELIDEAKELADQGVKELILVAQETTLYGKDIYGEKSLPRLLKALCKIQGLRWIRILYCYPEEITDELIQVIKEEPKICHYLDLPIQHASDAILKRMGRKTSKEQLISIIGKLREEIPDITLRTTLITGFPGETDEQHEELMDFVDQMEFERLGVFTYSPEEDTPAAEMPDQISEEIKQDRQAELMELQQDIVFDRNEDLIGEEMLVMIEGKVADENAYVGRTYRDAPNVDGLIFVNTDEELVSGDFAKVKVTGAMDYDLIGELL